MEFLGGRCVRSFGADVPKVGAVYDRDRRALVPVRYKGDVAYASVSDGPYYSCNRLKVWNGPQVVSAVQHAIDFGNTKVRRSDYEVTLGVPGAGKTWTMVKRLMDEKVADFVILAVTRKSAQAARKYAVKFGCDPSVAKARIMTVDRYLIHGKFPAAVVCVDEFPMSHIGRVDAAVVLTGAMDVRICGDAQQIPYDPFCAEFRMHHSVLGNTVSEARVTFLAESHRIPADVCAMWLDMYPAIYPCKCCGGDERWKPSVAYERIRNLAHLRVQDGVRYHGYKREDVDDIRVGLSMVGTAEELKLKEEGGLASVHEDQGSTHQHVCTIRTSVVYDKHASPRNPSLFNRLKYVLTDTTRHVKTYVYKSMCDEFDVVRKRIELARCAKRLDLVRQRKGMGLVTVADMLR